MFETGDRVYINDPSAINHRAAATVIEINHRPGAYPYQARVDGNKFAFWYAANMLIREPIETEPPAPPQQAVHDFDTGLGIGGLARHDEQGEILELIARGELRVTERQSIGKMPHGQLWEPCPRCGTEPVCLDCGYCEQHCCC